MVKDRIIESLEYCYKNQKSIDCENCEYGGRSFLICERLVDDILALLKEQGPVKPHYNARTNWYECGACHYSMTSGMHCRSELIPATKVRYCANCGFPVNWEGR
jgi:hypothetical protein